MCPVFKGSVAFFNTNAYPRSTAPLRPRFMILIEAGVWNSSIPLMWKQTRNPDTAVENRALKQHGKHVVVVDGYTGFAPVWKWNQNLKRARKLQRPLQTRTEFVRAVRNVYEWCIFCPNLFGGTVFLPFIPSHRRQIVEKEWDPGSNQAGPIPLGDFVNLFFLFFFFFFFSSFFSLVLLLTIT